MGRSGQLVPAALPPQAQGLSELWDPPPEAGTVGSRSGVFTKQKPPSKLHQVAAATALATGRAHAGAHPQVPAAAGAADAARRRPGAGHAEVHADGPAPGAADTCGGPGRGENRADSPCKVVTSGSCLRARVPPPPLLLLRAPSLYFYSPFPLKQPHTWALLPVV